MPRTTREPSHVRFTAELRRAQLRNARRRRLAPYVASLAGVLAASAGMLSTPWAPDEECELDALRALLGTSGSSDTVITAAINGTTVGTITLASGDTDVTVAIDEHMTPTDILTLELTTAGTDAANLTVKGALS